MEPRTDWVGGRIGGVFAQVGRLGTGREAGLCNGAWIERVGGGGGGGREREREGRRGRAVVGETQ